MHCNKNKAMWNVINSNMKSTIGKHCNISPNDFNSYFSNIANKIISSLPVSNEDPIATMQNTKQNSLGSYDKFVLNEISFVEMRNIINNLKNRNSVDYYGLNSKIIKHLKDLIIIPLTKLLNKAITLNIFPKAFKISRVVPVFKKGDADNASNYRPISIIPIFGKIFESALKIRVEHYFESKNLLSASQFGFRSGKSTISALADFVTFITNNINEGSYVASSFCDLTKAFDCLTHDLLLKKLEMYHFHPNTISFFKSYLSGRTQYVENNNVKSDPLPIKTGVLQGSVIGPLFFIIFVNDIVQYMSPCKLILFADDTTAVHTNSNLIDLQTQNSYIKNRLVNWFNANKLNLNENKTVDIIFTTKDLGCTVNPTEAKLLGIYLDPALTWFNHCDKISAKLSSLTYLFHNLVDCVSINTILTAYFSLFHSVLTYGILLWGHSASAKRVFALQRKVIRKIAKQSYRADTKPWFSKLNIMTLPAIYIYYCILHVKNNLQNYVSVNEIHLYNTRSTNNIYHPFYRINKTRFGVNYFSIKFYNVLPQHIRSLSSDDFEVYIKTFLIKNAFFSIDEFCQYKFH